MTDTLTVADGLSSGVLTAGFSGFVLGASLIIAIGAQNAYVLKLGILRLHVLPIVLICATSDAALITLGVAGFGTFIKGSQSLLTAITIGGSLFLFVYGLMAFRQALKPSALKADDKANVSLTKAVTTVLAFTFLNPHVYLDTVVLLGGLSARYSDQGQFAYGLGAVIASFVWFFALGYGARFLAPIFAKPVAWRVLDTLIGLVMWAIAAKLVTEFALP
ncbi:LysE/ArgO family amino acid transporter [Coralliovum pocilloporae]|uniref:LysE/ArgO family amino acid transporter n=1 Tax=Coralliovum pocilloporae TaxID=3066369 RepID=UPI0033077CDF